MVAWVGRGADFSGPAMDTIAKPVYYRGGLRGWSGFRAAIRSRGLDGSLWIAIDTLALLAAFWRYLPLP